MKKLLLAIFLLLGALNAQASITVRGLIIGGGGGGGGVGGGGGGAGQFQDVTGIVLTNSSYTITIGPGSAASGGLGGFGTATSFANLTSAGGAGGGTINTNGQNGGNAAGGGAGIAATNKTGGTGNFPGGDNTGGGSASPFACGGGGGSGQQGHTPLSTSIAGPGGLGTSSDISGSAQDFAGGGGGSIYMAGGGGIGGSGFAGGGDGSSGGTAGNDATANSGSGGGGGGQSSLGGAGASGIVIIRYLTSIGGDGTGGTIYHVGGDTIHVFTSSGTFVPPVPFTPTPTFSMTITVTQTITPTLTITPTFSNTSTITRTRTITATSTLTRTFSASPTITPSVTPSATPTITPNCNPGEQTVFSWSIYPSNNVVMMKPLTQYFTTNLHTISAYFLPARGGMASAALYTGGVASPVMITKTAFQTLSPGWNSFALSVTNLAAGSYNMVVLGSAQTRLSARAIGFDSVASVPTPGVMPPRVTVTPVQVDFSIYGNFCP